MSTLTHESEQHKNDPDYKRFVTALAAIAWGGYLQEGRGALFTDGKVTAYLPLGVIKWRPGITFATLRQLRQEVKTYNPRREVLLFIPWSNKPWTIRRVITEPDPETAFLQRWHGQNPTGERR